MSEPRFLKDTRVKFRWGLRFVQGVVKEDRGPIGVGGRNLYLVEFRPEPQSDRPFLIELPAEQLQLVQDTVSTE